MTEEAVVRVNQGRRIEIIWYFQAQPATTAQKVNGRLSATETRMPDPLKPVFGLSGYFHLRQLAFPALEQEACEFAIDYCLNEDVCPLLGFCDVFVFTTTADFPDGLLDLLACV